MAGYCRLLSFGNRFRLSLTRSCGDMRRFCGSRSCSEAAAQIVKCQNGRAVAVFVKFEETISFELFNSLSGCLGDRQAKESGSGTRDLSLKICTSTTTAMHNSRRRSIALLYRYSSSTYHVIWDRHENTTLDWIMRDICYTAVRLLDNSPDSLSLSLSLWPGMVGFRLAWLLFRSSPCLFDRVTHRMRKGMTKINSFTLSLSLSPQLLCILLYLVFSYSAVHSVL